ncbi:homoserine kinase [Aureococcus anophagefferens]|nr:homoserine kinase [Aureococcus anophagefferens]
MGPGFDALGMGIDIWNEISVERAGSFSIETEGEGVGAIPEEVGPNGESKHTVMVALKRAFEYGGARGYDLNQSQLPEELLQLATEMEGHPDNVEAQCHSVGAYEAT